MLTALCVNVNASFNEFVYDDILIIRDNPLVKGTLDVPAIFSSNYWLLASDKDPLYRPLSIISFALEKHFFGLTPVVVHWTNILLNAAIGVLVYILIRLLFGSVRLAFYSGMLFVTMPLHCEVVANGVGRSELLAAFFVLSGCITYLNSVRGVSSKHASLEKREEIPLRKKAVGYALVCIFIFLGLISKESAIMAPALLLLIDLLLVDKDLKTVASLAPRYLIFVAPIVGYLIMRNAVVGLVTPQSHELLSGIEPQERVLLSIETMMTYLRQFVFPLGLSADYHDYRNLPRPKLNDPSAAAAALAFVGILFVSMHRYLKGNSLPLFAALWFLIAVLPGSNLLTAIGTVQADRLVYLPSLGFALIGAWLVIASVRIEKSLPLIFINIALFTQVFMTIDRNLDWRNKESLWVSAVKTNPGSADAWRNVGDVYANYQRYDLAAQAYGRAAELKEQLGMFNRPAMLLLAKSYTELGEEKKAISTYKRVLEKNPRHLISILSLGQLYLKNAETINQALRIFKQAVELFPQSVHAHAHLAEALKSSGDQVASLSAINTALALSKRWPYVWAIKAEILQAMGRHEEANKIREKVQELGARKYGKSSQTESESLEGLDI